MPSVRDRLFAGSRRHGSVRVGGGNSGFGRDVGRGGHRTWRLGWSCEAATLTGRGPDDQDRLPLAELLAKAGDGDFLRSVAETVLQMLMEADVEA